MNAKLSFLIVSLLYIYITYSPRILNCLHCLHIPVFYVRVIYVQHLDY